MTSPLAWPPEFDEDEPRPEGLPAFPKSSRSIRTPSAVGAWMRETPLFIVAVLLVAFVLRSFVFQAFFIPSPSMGCVGCPVHTLELDDRVLVSKLSYRLHEPRRGDIVVFDCPATQICNTRERSGNWLSRAVLTIGEHVGVVHPSTEDYIKRVVALPGETVEARDGMVFINGQPLVEPYLPSSLATDAGSMTQPYVVPAGHLWVMGDNRGNSSDSRRFQAIPIDSVVGRAIVRFWPLNRAGFL